jgi:hypothetical protein
MKPFSMPDGVVQHFDDGARQFVVQEAFEMTR